MDGLGDNWVYNMRMCTGVLRKKKISELQIEANEIFTKNKYFGKKGE